MKVGLTISCILVGLLGYGQSVYQNVRVDLEDGNGYAPCEPSIAVNPKDPSQLVAGAILDRVYTSADSGKTWSKDRLTSSMGVFGDPCIIASNKGDFYYLHLSDPAGKGWIEPRILDRIVCQRSKDGGKTWSDGGGMGENHPKDQDKEWACTNERGNRIYATWTQFDKYDSKDPADSTHILFSKSNRKGKKWKKPVRLDQYGGNCEDDDLTVEGAVPCVGPNGEIYVAWARGETIWFDRSTNCGKTWLDEDIRATEMPGGWNQEIPGILRANGMPVTACDVSGGEHNGTIYINWADQRNGTDDTDVFLITSKDGGSTWSEPVRVNDDPAGKQQFFTWMTVDQKTGAIYVVFYDRRDHEGTETDVYLATSLDGGKTFQNERISSSPFTPHPGVFFGDYNNISAHNGVVRPIWTRYEDGKLSVWTALINK